VNKHKIRSKPFYVQILSFYMFEMQKKNASRDTQEISSIE